MRSAVRARPAGGVDPEMVVGSAQGRSRAPAAAFHTSRHLETYAKHHLWADARHHRRRYIEQLEHQAVGVALTRRLSPACVRRNRR